MRGEFIDVGDTRLYYFAAGSRGAGEPILLLHGFPTSSHLWAGLIPLLPSGHRVVVCDLLGYGRSDAPSALDLSIAGHARRVIALLDALNIDVATVIGHDLGGAIAQSIALSSASRVSRLGLCDSIGFGHWPDRTASLAKVTASATRHFPPSWIVSAFKRALSRGYAVPERGSHSLDQYLRPFATESGRDAFLRHVASMDPRETTALSDRLHTIAVPTAVVWGMEDPFLPRELAERFASSIPNATLDYIPDVGHFVPEEAPERLAQVISALMRR
ncbi:MAG: alpha/beta hydrolase [Gemmatimonadaceae bacterium]